MKKSALLILLVALFSGCNEVDLIQSDYTLYSGSSFGMCAGDECRQELTLNEYQAVLRTGAWTTDGNTELKVKEKRGVSADEWNAVLSLVDEGVLRSLPEVNGCPDCADGGAEWIEIRSPDLKKKITFEYRHAPEAIQDLTDKLRSIRDEMNAGQ